MNEYDDIIDLPHHVSKVHPQMPREQRAAQFAPFAALTGYEQALEEVSRITQQEKLLDEDEMSELNSRLSQAMLQPDIPVRITYFRKDEKRNDGTGDYLEAEGTIRKIDQYRQLLILQSGEQIPLSSIKKLSSTAFIE